MSSPSSSRLTTNACTIDDTTMSNSNINTCNAGNACSSRTNEGRVSCCPDSSSCSCGADNNNNNKNNIADSRFSCNICFDAVVEPVVTRCGHLYCWPCLFRWLEPGMLPEERQSLGMSYVYNNNNSGVINRRECPVCKSECSLSSLVPVFVRSSIRDDDDDDDDDDEKSLTNKNSKREQTTIDDDTNTSVRNGNGNGNDTNDDELDNGNEGEGEGDDSFINETPEKGIGIDLDESLPVTNNGSSSDDGLRRRRRRRMTSDNSNSNANKNNNNNNNNAVVPNRPSATNSPQQQPSSPVISSANNNINNNSTPSSSSRSRSNGWITPRSPNGHNASLTHGILLSFQRATAEYYRNSNNNNINHSNQYDQNQQQIPSLHDRRNPSSRNNNSIGDATSSAGRFQEGQQQVDVNSETTQYLSRLLIMLTSFVILCLLLV
jgi:hypothetical protein